MPGKANRTSRTDEMAESTAPLRHADTIASAVPSATLRTITISGPSSDARAPTSSRDRMSRPWPSSPSRWSGELPTNALARSIRSGSCGASQRPAMATMAASTTTAAATWPRTPVPRSPGMPRRRRAEGGAGAVPAVPATVVTARLTDASDRPGPELDAWVEHGVEEVDDGVEHDEDDDEDERDGLDDGEVLRRRGRHEVRAEPVQAEGPLDDRGERDQRRDRDASDGRDGDRGVAQHVASDHDGTGQTAARRRLHVLAREL